MTDSINKNSTILFNNNFSTTTVSVDKEGSLRIKEGDVGKTYKIVLIKGTQKVLLSDSTLKKIAAKVEYHIQSSPELMKLGNSENSLNNNGIKEIPGRDEIIQSIIRDITKSVVKSEKRTNIIENLLIESKTKEINKYKNELEAYKTLINKEFPGLYEQLSKKIDELQILMQSKGSGNEVNAERKTIKEYIEIFKTSSASQKVFKKLGKGKAKQAWETELQQEIREKKDFKLESQKAYLTPVKSSFETLTKGKENELRQEVQTTEDIKKGLNGKGSDYLALDLKELKGDDKINDQFTVITDKAIGDLETTWKKEGVQEKLTTFPNNLKICLQFLLGMKDMHESGHGHGDLKPDNLFVYGNAEDKEFRVKISDFGKTKKLTDTSESMYTGNPRFSPPEGTFSKKGEVFSSGIMLIRILEEGLLKGKGDMLVQPKEIDGSLSKTANIGSGIEAFLVKNKNCPQTEFKTLRGKITVISRRVLLAIRKEKNDYSKAETEVHRYISALTEELKVKHPGNDEKLDDLNLLLQTMTRSNPSGRPTIEKASMAYQEIMGDILDKA